MSIASAIVAKQQQVADAYTAISNKGGTLPQTQNLTNMPTAIASIPSGTTPSGTISITSNGTYDVTNYASASVNVSGGVPRDVINGVYKAPTSSFSFSLPSGTTTVGENSLNNGLSKSGVTSINLSNATSVLDNGCSQICYQCPNLVSADLSTITTTRYRAFYYAFYACSNLANVNLSSLTTAGDNSFYYAFYDSAIKVMDFQALVSLDTNAFYTAFQGSTNLTDIYFRALTTTSFGSYKNQFRGMLSACGITKTVTLHFPSNMETTISGLSGYPKFGGKNIVLAYDLPATS